MAATQAKAIPIADTEPTNTPDEFSYKHATFEEVLEDLSSRFILNLPEDELAEVERVCFQVEQAHWYYEDFIREENPSFASLPLKKFSEILFRSCPLLHHWSHDHETAFNGFMSYKTRVPVCGAIMLNEALTKCLLVKGWKSSAGWGFPKGKVNENEDEAFCAVREVLEETGYNLSGQIRRTDCIRLCVKQQPITLFVVAGVPEEFPFKTQTRKEISKIEWFKLVDLPMWKKSRTITNKFYLITPVISPLKAIVRNLRTTRKATNPQSHALQVAEAVSSPEAEDEADTEDPGSAVAEESLATVEREASSQGQSGEAEISSSQSSSIDPHTPSVNEDPVPHPAASTLVFKHSRPGVDDIPVDTHKKLPVEVSPPSLNADPRTHWTRLMTRLNYSEESTPQRTPQASTPTPPVPRSPPRPELQPPDTSQPLLLPTLPGRALGRPSELMEAPRGNVEGHLPAVPRLPSLASPILSSDSLPNTTSNLLPPRGLPIPSAPLPQASSPSDVLKRRTRQLQLLESVIAEDTQRFSHSVPPLSAHAMGTYPRPPDMLIPDQVSTAAPPRSMSVNPEVSRSQLAPYQQHKYSTPSLSGVSLTSAATSSQHQMFRSSHVFPHHTFISSSSRGITPTVSRSRPATAIPSQLYLPSQQFPVSTSSGTSPASYDWNSTVDTLHKDQMLSILSGRGNASRLPTLGTHGTSSDRLSQGNFSSASTAICPMVSAPQRTSHLLSILNNPSPTCPRHLQDRSSLLQATKGG